MKRKNEYVESEEKTNSSKELVEEVKEHSWLMLAADLNKSSLYIKSKIAKW